MKKKWKLRILFICIMAILIYSGYGIWNFYLDERQNIEGVQWVVPLSDEYSQWDYHTDILQEALEEIGLELIFSEDKDFKGNVFVEKLYGAKNSQGETVILPILLKKA